MCLRAHDGGRCAVGFAALVPATMGGVDSRMEDVLGRNEFAWCVPGHDACSGALLAFMCSSCLPAVAVVCWQVEL